MRGAITAMKLNKKQRRLLREALELAGYSLFVPVSLEHINHALQRGIENPEEVQAARMEINKLEKNAEEIARGGI